MYSLLFTVMDLMMNAFWGFCLCRFFCSFLRRKRLRFGGDCEEAGTGSEEWHAGGLRRGGWLLWGFWMTFKVFLEYVRETDYSSVGMLVRLFFLYGGLLLFTGLFYCGKKGNLSFVFVTFAAVSEISRFLAYTVSLLGNWLYTLSFYFWENGFFDNVQQYVSLTKAVAMAVQLIMNVIFGLVMWKTLSCVRRTCSGELSLERTELMFLLLPGVTGFLFCVLLRVIMVNVEEQIPRLLYDRYPLLTGVVPALLLLCNCSILYSVKLYRQLQRLHEEKNRSAILERQLNSMEEQLRETERVYAGVRAMKHDMRNQLAVLAELTERPGARAEFETYLEQMNRMLGQLEFPCRTGSAAVDTLFGIKCHEMQERVPGIRFDAEGFIVPENLRIYPMDLSVILGNGLDNAIEACERLAAAAPDEIPWIRVSALYRTQCFLVEIENSFDGRLSRLPEQEFPETSKGDGQLHGIGLRSIETVARKYHGGVDWSAEGGVFTLTVLLKSKA